MDKYMVILNGGKGRPLPMVDENDDIALYDDQILALEGARQNALGKARGFKIILWEYFEQ